MSPVFLETPGGLSAFHRVVLDYTGTLSLDGQLLPGVEGRLHRLARDLQITILTADTFGTARESVKDLPVNIQVIQNGQEKAGIVAAMDAEGVIAIGNGRNDIPMMEVAAISIAVLGPEGAAASLLHAADIVTRDINDALDLLLNPLRLKATLRN